MISIIIPTLNEEKLIGQTLKQFKNLKNKFDFEIIVSDNNSNDKTIEIARNYSCKLIKNKSSFRNISSNRNFGSKHSAGDILVFLDADILIKNINVFFKQIIKEFNNPKLIACTPKIFINPKEENNIDKIINRTHTFLSIIINKLGIGYARGGCQIIRKSSFILVKGYNEKLIAGEDVEIFNRLGKIGEIKILSKEIVYESPRRYRKNGYTNVLFTWFINYVYALLFNKSYSSEWKDIR